MRYILAGSLLLIGLVAFALEYSPPAAEIAPDASLISMLVDDEISQEQFEQALEPGALEFPRDLGPHDGFQTEWWYYTGNLEAADGRPFGFQFTIFRRALTPADAYPPAPAGRDSKWRSNQVYMAHFTISDIEAQRFYPSERFSRSAIGLAGAQAEPYRVWLEDWTAEQIAPGKIRLYAQTEDATLDVVLTETLPPVLHGNQGLSAKGAMPGNASYYYSIVQQKTAGTVTLAGETFKVTGLSWKDHEFSTSALSADAVGWDWYALQLDNDTSLMLFQIRREDGSVEPVSNGSFILADGSLRHLDLEDWQVEVLDTWTSPVSGGTYPAAWQIVVPELGLSLEGRPLMADQELNLSTVYWEGAVHFDGQINGEPVSATGYIEMTGYAGDFDGRM